MWGDVPALMPAPVKAQKFNPDGTAHPPGSWFAVADSKNRGAHSEILAMPESELLAHSQGLAQCGELHREKEAGQKTQAHPNKRDGHAHTKHLTNPAEHEGVKAAAAYRGQCSGWGVAQYTGSKSKARKAASAAIAKIPFPLAVHIAKYWHPQQVAA